MRVPILLAALLATDASASEVARFALVVGANHGLEEETPLRFAEEDADRMARVLGSVGDVRADRIVLLRSTSAADVEGALDALQNRIASLGETDSVLVVYYSGHAGSDALHLNGTRLGLKPLREQLERGPSDVSVLIVDACQSGALTRKGVEPAAPFAMSNEASFDSEGIAILTSSAVGEDAAESDLLQGGVFTHHLVNGLLGAADASQDGLVTLAEARTYAYTHTLASTSRTDVVQHPSSVVNLRGSADLVLSNLAGAQGTGSLAFDTGGTYLLFDDEADLLAEVTITDGGQVRVPPGAYRVRRREPGHVREDTVEVPLQDTGWVVHDAMQVQPYGETVRKGLASERSLATMLTLSGGFVPPLHAGTSFGPSGALGVRFDLAPLSVGVRVGYAQYQWRNEVLGSRVHRPSVDVYAAKLFDVGPVAPGLGLRAGVDLYRQTFETEGISPPQWSAGGRVGALGGLEAKLSPRVVLGVWGGADMLMLRRGGSEEDPQTRLGLVASPYAMLELGVYVD